MSWVANLLLTVNLPDEPLVESLSRWLETDCPWNTPSTPPGAKGVGFLRPLTGDDKDVWGGWKRPEVTLWAGVLNHADLVAVRRQVESMPWREPQWLQLFLQDQEEPTFRLYMFAGDQLQQYAPLRDNEGPRTY